MKNSKEARKTADTPQNTNENPEDPEKAIVGPEEGQEADGTRTPGSIKWMELMEQNLLELLDLLESDQDHDWSWPPDNMTT